MKISIQELAQMRRDFSQVWPDDLLDDLEDSDPHIVAEGQRQKELLANKRQELSNKRSSETEPENCEQPKIPVPVIRVKTEKVAPVKKVKPQPIKPVAPVFAKDTLVVRGWNDMRIRGKKNWADFENLLSLYALRKLFTAEMMPEKAKQDKTELTYVVEEFDRLKRPKRRTHDSAEKRLASQKTYIAFGKRTIDASCESDLSKRDCDLHDLEREYMDAEDNNEDNGWKLRKTYQIALQVIYNLRQRY